MNELQDALWSGRQVSRKGFFLRLQDAFLPMELSIDPPQVAMAAAQTTIPQTQGERKEHVHQQQTQAQLNKTDPDVVKFMKDVKAELGAIRTLILKLEAQLMNTSKRKQDDHRAKHGNAAHGKTHKGQKGRAAVSAPVMPATYMSSSASEHEEEVHFANYA